jgi:hypothetical protein
MEGHLKLFKINWLILREVYLSDQWFWILEGEDLPGTDHKVILEVISTTYPELSLNTYLELTDSTCLLGC